MAGSCGSGALGSVLVAGGQVCATAAEDRVVAKANENAETFRRNDCLILTAYLMLNVGGYDSDEQGVMSVHLSISAK